MIGAVIIVALSIYFHEQAQWDNLPFSNTWDSDKNTIKHNMQESQDASPFPVGDHKAAMNRQESIKFLQNLWSSSSWASFDDLSPINAKWMSAWSYTIFKIYHYQECVYLGKQRRPWWDAAFCGFSSGSTLFVYVPFSHAFSLFHECVFWILG